MISSLDSGSELFLASVDRIQKSLAQANQQVTSGKRIATASDAPDQIGTLLQLRADLQHNSQIQSNLTQAKADASAADTALSSAITMLDQAMTLGEQGASTTQTSDIRLELAQQVQSILEQMVAVSRTTVEGRYIFNGDQGSTPPFRFDTTLLGTNPVVQMSTSGATQQIEDPAGGSFAAAKSGAEIFGAPSSVFTALNNLRLALLSGNDSSIAAAIDPIKQASTQLNSMQSFYGNVENRIQSASDFAATRDTQLQSRISDVEDADVTAAALQFTQGNTQLQAAFQMRAKMPHNTLFDYLG